MKKFVSILLVFAILAGVAGISATAEGEDYSVYPESKHNYDNNCNEKWIYVHPEEAEGLFVTFSADTYVEPENTYNDGEIWEYKGDSISIYAIYEKDHFYVGSFSGDELASKTLYIPGSSFWIELYTDSSVTEYGFKIERIDAVAPENVNVICYNFSPNNMGIEKYYECFNDGETVIIAENLPVRLKKSNFLRNGNEYCCGWATEPDGELAYDNDTETMLTEDFLNLYASWTPLLIGSDDVFNFGNSGYIFNLGDYSEDAQSYYMTSEDHNMLLRNARRLGLPGLFFYSELKNYPYRGFEGSCFGMACSVYLQYHGAIDMLSLQESAETVKELKPSAEVVSTINYYQSLTLLSYLCTNQGYGVGSDEYKKQLKAVYDTVSGGTPVLMSMLGEERYIFGYNHSMIITGAYTDTQGNHYLLAYDGQIGYAEDEIWVIPVAPDFSSFNNGNTFYWTAESEFFEAFDMEGEGSPLKWYKEFIPQIANFLKMLIQYLPVLLGK